jgi:putative transposase
MKPPPSRGQALDQDQYDPLRGWAPRGERLVDKVPLGKWKTATFLAALRNDRIEAPCLFEGPINGERFHAYVERVPVPTLKPGDVVILDISAPTGERPCH